MDESPIGRIWNCLVSGDSISKGVVLDEGEGGYSVLKDNYVAIVQRRTRNVIRNVSRFGNTLPRGTGRLAREIESEKPDIVLIEYGGNDCDFDWVDVAAHPDSPHGPKTELALFETTLAETIQGLGARGIIPVLMTLPPLDAERFLAWVSRGEPGAEGRILTWLGNVNRIFQWQEGYSALIAKVAAETKTRLIDVREAFLQRFDFRSLICKDGIHPNAAGHEVIAEAVLGYLAGNYPFMLSEGIAGSLGIAGGSANPLAS
jgi:lysophospholipase L1-like esterase